MQIRSRLLHYGIALLGLLGAHAAEAAALRDGADLQNRFVGAAVNMTPFRNEAPYRDTLSREFNMLVAENAFKMDALRPSRTTFNFTDADALVAFAEANHMAVRGHTLVWHSQIPSWLTGGNFTRDQVIAIMQEHISTVVGRYRGRIAAWDVVNEAINDSNGQLRSESFWLQKIGPEYVAMAFQFARAADPDAVLYYNDYSAEGSGTKSDGVFNLVSGLRSQGVPIGGVGWQMHQVNGFRIGSAHRTNAQRLAGLGLEISITELDVRIPLPTDSAKLEQQALAYGDVVTFCIAQPNCKAVVSWGFTDKYSWIPGFFSGFGDALPFDANYQAKPAYFAMQDAFEGPSPAFTLSATPASVSVNRGASVTSTIGIARSGGFTGSVGLTASGLPSGVTASFNPTSVTGTASTLTLTASSTATTGPATVTVTGTGGGLTRTASIALTVNAPATPDFTVSASPASVTVNRGASATSSISLTRVGGFASAVALTATGLPSGVTASFNPASVTGTASTLTLSASSTATTGPATVTVTGSGGGLTRATTIALTVSAPSTGTGGVTVTAVVTASSPWFNEEQVRIANTANVTAMSLTIVVQRTAGVGFSGQYNTVGGQIQQANSSTTAAVTYTFTLAAGQTLSPATSRTFAAQTSGSGTVHPTAGDTYTLTYTTGGTSFTQSGHF